MLFVDAAHESSRWGQDLIDEDEDGLLGGELDSLADNVDELAYGKVGGDEIFLLVDGGDIALLDLLTNDRNAIGVFLADALGLSLALLEGVLVLKLATHGGDRVKLAVTSKKGGGILASVRSKEVVKSKM